MATKQLNEAQLREVIKKMISEQTDAPSEPAKAEGPQSWFTPVNITRVLQTKMGRELANNKDARAELANVLSVLVKKRYQYPEIQAVMAFIEKYKS